MSGQWGRLRESVKVFRFVLAMQADAAANAVFGSRCPDCGERVYPKDHAAHARLEHAGDHHL